MSCIFFKKTHAEQKRILTRNCLGRTTLEKVLIPAAILLLSGCILFGVLFFANRNKGDKETNNTTAASVLGEARESSGKDETEPGSLVKETQEDSAAALDAATDASDTDGSTAGGTTKAAQESKTTTKSTTKAATAAPGVTTSWSEVTIAPTTTAASSSLFSVPSISIPADLGTIPSYTSAPSSSISIPADYGTIPSFTY